MQLRTREDIRKLGTIMGIWAHPDDEVMSCGGLLCAAAKNGQRLICITATQGEAGVQDENRWPASSLGEIRVQELRAAYQLLGVTEHHFLNYPDGGCKYIDHDEASAKLSELINKYQPDTILTFGPDGITGHDDHRAVSSWTSQAAKSADSSPQIFHVTLSENEYELLKETDKKFNIFFNIDKPVTINAADCDICLELDKELLECKMRCLEVMPSQYEALLNEMGEDFGESLKLETFIKVK